MAERPTYKLRFLDPKKRFPAMPEQPAGRSYGVVWKVFGEDPKESCYVVEFVGKSHISLLGYVSVSGEVYKVDRPVSEVSLPDEPDMQLVLDESNPSVGEIAVTATVPCVPRHESTALPKVPCANNPITRRGIRLAAFATASLWPRCFYAT